MIYLEAFLLAILALLLVNTSISDLRTGRVPNKRILAALGLGMLAAVPYYALFARDCLLSYAVNNVLLFGIGIILYSSGMWGAGDCKLLCTVIALFPARLYCLSNRSIASCFLLILLVFLAAFAYLIGETVYLGIKQKNLFVLREAKVHIFAYLKSFLFFFLFINLWNALLSQFARQWILEDVLLLTAIHFMLLLLTMKIEPKVSWTIIGLMGLAWVALLLLRIAQFSVMNINWKTYLVLFILMLFRSSADKYNYQAIHVSELRPGMILSAASTMLFSGSKIQGLPLLSSEDLKSRLSTEEVESIKRWAKAKAGRDTLVIVRKIPFALFIAVGTVAFTILEVLIQ